MKYPVVSKRTLYFLFAVAHCRLRFKKVPFMCLTATATENVRMDIVRTFKLRPSKTLHLRGSVNRLVKKGICSNEQAFLPSCSFECSSV